MIHSDQISAGASCVGAQGTIVMNTERFTYPSESEPMRIDLFISSQLEGETRASVQRLIEAGNVLVDGQPVRSSLKLKGGEQITVEIPAPVEAAPQAESIPLDVLYEDHDLIVINKPAGMVVHPGAGNQTGTLANAVLAHAPGVARVGCGHRGRDVAGRAPRRLRRSAGRHET